MNSIDAAPKNLNPQAGRLGGFFIAQSDIKPDATLPVLPLATLLLRYQPPMPGATCH